MRRKFLATILLSSLVTSTLCAAMPIYSTNNYGKEISYKGEIAPILVHHWQGFYLGGNLGGKWGKLRVPVSTGSVVSPDLVIPEQTIEFNTHDKRLTGGVQLGFNAQHNCLVYGLEADFNAVRLKGKQDVGVVPQEVFVLGDSFSTHTNWESSLRARIGYATNNNWLFYATGGAAFLNIRAHANFIESTGGGIVFPASHGSETRTLVGGTIGVGGEYAFLDCWSVGAEYRYSAYRKKTFDLGTVAAIAVTPTTFIDTPVTAKVRVHTNEILAKINYKFA